MTGIAMETPLNMIFVLVNDWYESKARRLLGGNVGATIHVVFSGKLPGLVRKFGAKKA